MYFTFKRHQHHRNHHHLLLILLILLLTPILIITVVAIVVVVVAVVVTIFNILLLLLFIYYIYIYNNILLSNLSKSNVVDAIRFCEQYDYFVYNDFGQSFMSQFKTVNIITLFTQDLWIIRYWNNKVIQST